ncbi:MAG: toprim domain-containing protein [Acidithiobacillus ferrivorans]
MNDHRIEFFNALQSGGVGPASPSALVADGLLHRHRIEGDKPGSLNGWHVLHLDSPASGAGGSWKAGHSAKWCSKRLSALTASERALLSQRIEQDRKRSQEAQEARHKDAAARALHIWKPLPPASPRHPYLERKGIAPGIARQSRGALVLPVVDFTGQLWGCQFIGPDGSKRFLSGMKKSGCFIRTDGMPSPDSRLLICEGWATGQTLAALSPGAVVLAALDAGNLQAVAVEARRLFPALDIVIAADLGEAGMTKAKAAAIASRARWIWPKLPADAPAWVNDFNDWHTWRKSQRQGVAS